MKQFRVQLKRVIHKCCEYIRVEIPSMSDKRIPRIATKICLLHSTNLLPLLLLLLLLAAQEPIELKKRLDEVRLLESRRSPRLADQDRDTDFARLADMGDRRRTTHSIEVPLTQTPSHK